MEKEEKKCRGCGETKLLSEYHKKKTGKYWRDSKCKVCVKAYRESEKRKAYMKAYRKAYNQSEKGKAANKAYMKAYEQSEKGKAKRKAYQKAYRQSEEGKAYMKTYMKTYRESEAGKAYMKSYMKNRRQTDPVFKLHKNLSSGFYHWIKGHTKTCRTEQYVCCTYKELLDYLESQFEEGMTWENHGRGDNKWQIDHFKAQSCFDPAIEEEKYMCWHWTNLQPMWAEINNGWKDKSKPGDENRFWLGREIGWVNI